MKYFHCGLNKYYDIIKNIQDDKLKLEVERLENEISELVKENNKLKESVGILKIQSESSKLEEVESSRLLKESKQLKTIIIKQSKILQTNLWSVEKDKTDATEVQSFVLRHIIHAK